MRYAMMVDLDECVGCQACVSACKEQWDSGNGAARDWVHTFEHGIRGLDLGITFYPGLCMQCAAHPCTGDCPSSATFLNERGIVVVDPDVCIGCGNCMSLCPYGARKLDETKGIVEKCNLCEPYVLRGEEPACVRTCLAECRIFGDLDDPGSLLVQEIARRGARPLVTDEIDVGPKVTFAGDARRSQVLAHGAVHRPDPSALTRFWAGYSLPLARFVTPAVALTSIAGGFVINWIGRRREVAAAASSQPASGGTKPEVSVHRSVPVGTDAALRTSTGDASRSGETVVDSTRAAVGATDAAMVSGATGATVPSAAPPAGEGGASDGGHCVVGVAGAASASQASAGVETDGLTPVATGVRELHRHRAGMRFLHWWNAVSWLVLLATGTALLSSHGFALFGTAYPDWVASLVGGRGALMRWHVLWGLVWAAVIVPFFLLFKEGGREALHEVRLTKDDLRWLFLKPLSLVGRVGAPLPPQDKYNAGQKVFALTAVLGTATIIVTGLVMTFHIGPWWAVASAMVVHKLAIAFALMGLSVHLTMAAIVREERPALGSMISGRIDRTHAAAHSARWVESIEKKESSRE